MKYGKNNAGHLLNAFCKEMPPNRTKTFHVKHFCPVGAENLTRPHTLDGLERSGIARKTQRGPVPRGRGLLARFVHIRHVPELDKSSPLAESQSLMVLSGLPEASVRPSGE